jgi:hypothetical protein
MVHAPDDMRLRKASGSVWSRAYIVFREATSASAIFLAGSCHRGITAA